MTPALIALLYLPGSWVYPGAAVAGGFVLATLPLGVVMAQTLAPRGRSMVSSLMMGLAYGLGGIVTPAIGGLCDLFSIRHVLLGVALIPLLSLALIRRFPQIGNLTR
jgi:FSR family fosmidomycin resistance protein-like MFS transporter